MHISAASVGSTFFVLLTTNATHHDVDHSTRLSASDGRNCIIINGAERRIMPPRQNRGLTEELDNQDMETPLLHQSRSSSTSATTPTSASRTTTEQQLPSLSTPLQLLYCLNGVTLAFPMLALTYIVNTRVALPVSALSVYGALSFSPFSLKPLYAYLSSKQQQRRSEWIAFLLTLSGLSIAGTALVPDHNTQSSGAAVGVCLLLAFARGVTSAWPEFLLGLTLMEEAAAITLTVTSRSAASFTADANAMEYAAAVAADAITFQQMVLARFQSQAATARNFGSLVAHASVLILMMNRHLLLSKSISTNSTSSGGELSNGLVNTMLFITGGLNLLGALIFACCYCPWWQPVVEVQRQDYFHREMSSHHHHHAAIIDNGNNNDGYSNDIIGMQHERGITTQQLDNNNQRQSEARDDEHLDGSTSPTLTTTTSYCDVWLIVILQVAMMLFVFRDSISNWLSPNSSSSSGNNRKSAATTVIIAVVLVFTAAAIICVIIIIALGWYREQLPQQNLARPSSSPPPTFYETNEPSNRPWQQQRYRVALFLVLRHAMPTSSVVVSSFFYSMFQATPLILQIFLLTDMAMTSLASWSYGQILAKYSHGVSLSAVIAGTTVLSSLAELLLLLVTATPPSNNDSSYIHSVGGIACLILVKSMITFSGEWRFLPDVVLATQAAVAGAAETRVPATTDARELLQRTEPSHRLNKEAVANLLEFAELSYQSKVSNNNDDDRQQLLEGTKRDGDAARNVRTPTTSSSSSSSSSQHQPQLWYGTLISCIDLGEQIGSWLTLPLVTALDIRRDNEFAQLHVLIGLGALFGVLALSFLSLLKNKLTTD